MEFTIIVDQHERISQTDDDGDAMGFSQEERQEEIDAPNKRIIDAGRAAKRSFRVNLINKREQACV